jgi:hypothetical protein
VLSLNGHIKVFGGSTLALCINSYIRLVDYPLQQKTEKQLVVSGWMDSASGRLAFTPVALFLFAVALPFCLQIMVKCWSVLYIIT